jgi:hypothetical protein
LAIFSQTHLVTLLKIRKPGNQSEILKFTAPVCTLSLPSVHY